MRVKMGSNTAPDVDHSDEEFDIGEDYSWLFSDYIEEEDDET